jgi:hypothetical protein
MHGPYLNPCQDEGTGSGCGRLGTIEAVPTYPLPDRCTEGVTSAQAEPFSRSACPRITH